MHSGLAAQRHEQMTQLLVHLLRARDGLGDFRPQQVTEAPAEAMHGNLDGSLGHVQLRGDGLIAGDAQ